MPLMFRNVSCCPANDASGRSSAVALERTAHDTNSGCGSPATSFVYASRMPSLERGGNGCARIQSRTFAPTRASSATSATSSASTVRRIRS